MNTESKMKFGRVITREMVSMLQDESLDDLTVGQMMRAIVCDKIPENKMLASFANTFKCGYVLVNSEYIERQEKKQKYWREYNKNKREKATRNNSQQLATTRDTPQHHIETIRDEKNNNIPLSPKGEKGEVYLSAAGVLETLEEWAARMVVGIMATYPYKVNETNLGQVLMEAARKNSPARVEGGFRAWCDSGAWDEKRFIPRRIASWVKEGHYLDEPPKKNSAARAEPRASAAPSADATARLLADNGEDD